MEHFSPASDSSFPGASVTFVAMPRMFSGNIPEIKQKTNHFKNGTGAAIVPRGLLYGKYRFSPVFSQNMDESCQVCLSEPKQCSREIYQNNGL